MYGKDQLFKFSTMTSSDIGGCWGKEHTAELSADKTQLTIKEFAAGSTFSGLKDKI